jgi:hypothetical protein
LTRIFSLDGAFLAGAVIEAGFADVDGDGFTDLVVRTPGKDARTPLVFLVPPASRTMEVMQPDAASLWPLREATSLDDAIRRAVAIPSRGLTSAEACALLTGPVAAGVALFEYTEPNIFDAGRTMRRVSPARHRELQGTDARCAEPLKCSPTRPVCRDRFESDPSLSYYWFHWPKGQLQLAAQADYGGS